jgi:transposase
MVLAYSRLRFLRFGLRAAMPSFLRGHVESFRFFNAVPRLVLYDNLKSAVLEREGDAVRFHPTLLALAGHYRFEPRACAPYRPNEKGCASHCTSSVGSRVVSYGAADLPRDLC